jgi:imidazolonepropionase-like amidohydrolase
VLAKAREVIDAHAESFRRAVAAGVKVAMGTDSAVTRHGENLRELELMASGGMRPSDVLVAATARAAELLRVEHELGTLEPGKCADVVVVDGDPLDLRAIGQRVRAVYMDGECVAGTPERAREPTR